MFQQPQAVLPPVEGTHWEPTQCPFGGFGSLERQEYHVFRDEDIMGVIQERRFGDPLATLGDALATRGSPLAPNGADVLILWTKSEN